MSQGHPEDIINITVICSMTPDFIIFLEVLLTETYMDFEIIISS